MLLIAASLFIQVSFAQKIVGAGPVSITVSDMDRSLDFYTKVLPFQKIAEQELYGDPYEKLEGLFGIRMRIALLKLGDEEIELIDYLTAGGRSIPEDARSNDLSFQHIAIVVSDMDKAYEQLRKHQVVHVSTGPQTLPPSIPEAAGVKAFYFQDPDKHNLELIFFPKGKGQDKWQHPAGKLFLGIDHTAFGVSDTDNSLRFYRDLLGIERKGDSHNKGTEQEHLNNVEGASLHITGLRAPQGIGLEFLQYINPGPGKKYPADTRADDLWQWQTTLIADNAAELYRTLSSLHYSVLSKGLILLPGTQGTNTRAFIVRDPDGHALLIREK
ncbi:MAG TPA: VOC family protein [Ferruginibacter sp.]|nr:VOC family protein [Ferruginibacter sp.]